MRSPSVGSNVHGNFSNFEELGESGELGEGCASIVNSKAFGCGDGGLRKFYCSHVTHRDALNSNEAEEEDENCFAHCIKA